MSYPDLFKRAASLWWRTRALWPLGILAALFGAGDFTTGGNVSLNNSFSTNDLENLPPDVVDTWLANPLVRAFSANPEAFFIGFVAILLLWALIATLVGQLAHGAMIYMADRSDQGARVGLGEALGAGAARLLPMFFLGVIIAMPVVLLVLAVLAVSFPLIAAVVAMNSPGAPADPQSVLLGLGGALLCLVPLGLLAWVLSIALAFFGRVAQRVCVLEALGPLASLRRAWPLVTRNFGSALLAWFTTVMLGVVYGIVTGLPALAIALPAFVGALNTGTLPWPVLVGLIVYALLTTALLGGWLTSFNSALWTVLYRAFRARERAFAVPASYAPGD